jgi:hypothetical protein
MASFTVLRVGRLLATATLVFGLSAPAVASNFPLSPSVAHSLIVRPHSAFGAAEANWSQFGFDAGHTWFNPHETILNAGNVGQLRRAWKTSTGPQNLPGNVVESRGVLYAASANGTLFALDASTGTRIWTFSSGQGYGSSGSVVAVDNGLVFTLCNLPSGSQGLCALRADTGTIQWTYGVPGATSSSYPAAPPVVSEGTVFLGACGTGCAYVALDEKTGRTLWKTTQLRGCLNNAIPPAVYHDVFYATIDSCDDAAFIALNARSGQELWLEQPTFSAVFVGMAAGEDRVVVDTLVPFVPEYTIFLLSPQYGFTWWAESFQGGEINPAAFPAIAYDRVFAPSSGKLFAFRRKSRTDFPRLNLIVRGDEPSAAIANGVLYTLIAGYPSARSPFNHAILWRDPDRSRERMSSASPIVVNGTVYGACDGDSVCSWTLPSMIRPGR